MKPKTLVLMVVAVTCGLGASYMTSRLLAERGSGDTEKTNVLVARKQLNMGAAIKVPQDMFEEKQYVKGEEPPGAILDFEQLKGRILKKSLRQGDFVRVEDMLSAGDPASAFEVNLPQGFRAMGLRVNMESAAAGFATLPLSRVDLFLTVRRGDDKTSYSKVLLENVLVLAADTRTQRDESGAAMPTGVVIFALAPEDVMKVNLAREMGPLSLALRKQNDHAKSGTEMITIEDLKNNSGGHKTDGSGTEIAVDGSTTGVGSLPMAPKLNTDEVVAPLNVKDVQPPPPPPGREHRLVIHEGGDTRHVTFRLDDQGRVLNQDVTRSELPAPQRPPSVTKSE